MNLRKQRVPFQGISNFTRTAYNYREGNLNLKVPRESTTYREGQNSQNSFKPAQSDINNKNKTCVVKPQLANNSLQQIQKHYKKKTNVFRLAKSWKFAEKGYIDASDLKNKMQRIMNNKLNQNQLDQIVNEFSTQEGKIDLQDFFRLIYNQSEQPTYKPRLFNANLTNKYRQHMLDKLIEKVDSKSAQGRKIKYNSEDFLQNQTKQNKHFELESIKPLTQKSTQSLESSTYFGKQQFNRLMKTSYQKIKSSIKKYDLHPGSMSNENQGKLRFGITSLNFSKLKQNKQINKENKSENQVRAIRNYGLTLGQKEQKMKKLQRRLQKIRQTEETRKLAIQRIQNKNQEKENARIARKRYDRQAYEYACYIKNSWI